MCVCISTQPCWQRQIIQSTDLSNVESFNGIIQRVTWGNLLQRRGTVIVPRPTGWAPPGCGRLSPVAASSCWIQTCPHPTAGAEGRRSSRSYDGKSEVLLLNMQCLQVLHGDIQMTASLLCIKSRDCRDWAPEPWCLGTTLQSRRWHTRAYLSSPGASSSVFLAQCWAVPALGAAGEASTVLFCWVCFHTPSPSSCPLLCATPEHPFPAVPTKAGCPSAETPACPTTSIALLLVTGLTSQPSRLLVALPLFGISCQAATCHSWPSPQHTWRSCPSFHCWVTFSPLRRSFGAIKGFSSWISKLPIELNALPGYRASTSGRSSRRLGAQSGRADAWRRGKNGRLSKLVLPVASSAALLLAGGWAEGAAVLEARKAAGSESNGVRGKGM